MDKVTENKNMFVALPIQTSPYGFQDPSNSKSVWIGLGLPIATAQSCCAFWMDCMKAFPFFPCPERYIQAI